MICCSVAADLAALMLYHQSDSKALWIFSGSTAALLGLYYLADFKKYRTQLNSLLIIGLGMCLKLYYVLVTSVDNRQHDVYSFSDDCGHAGYIEYLLNNHHLPAGRVRQDRWKDSPVL